MFTLASFGRKAHVSEVTFPPGSLRDGTMNNPSDGIVSRDSKHECRRSLVSDPKHE